MQDWDQQRKGLRICRPVAQSTQTADAGTTTLSNHTKRSHSAKLAALQRLLEKEIAAPAKPRAARVIAASLTTTQFLQTPPTSSQLAAHPVLAVLVSQPLLRLQPPTKPSPAPQPNDTTDNLQGLPHQTNLPDLQAPTSKPARSLRSSITLPAKLNANDPLCVRGVRPIVEDWDSRGHLSVQLRSSVWVSAKVHSTVRATADR